MSGNNSIESTGTANIRTLDRPVVMVRISRKTAYASPSSKDNPEHRISLPLSLEKKVLPVAALSADAGRYSL